MDGEKLRRLREERGLTRRQVEDGTGVSQTNLWRIESGDIENSRIGTVKVLADFYGVTVAEIIGEEG